MNNLKSFWLLVTKSGRNAKRTAVVVDREVNTRNTTLNKEGRQTDKHKEEMGEEKTETG